MGKTGATPASEWRDVREKGRLMRFPSGQSAYLRPVGMDFIVKFGKIPDSLISFIEDSLKGTIAILPDSPTTKQNLLDRVRYLDALCECCFVSPRAVAEERELAEDEISVDDIEIGDKIMLQTLINMPSSLLVKFCEEQAGAMVDLVNLAIYCGFSVKTDGNPRMGDGKAMAGGVVDGDSIREGSNMVWTPDRIQAERDGQAGQGALQP